MNASYTNTAVCTYLHTANRRPGWNGICTASESSFLAIMHQDHLRQLETDILNGLAEIEALEPRKTPALVGPGCIIGGVLTLNFDNANDSITLSQTGDDISIAIKDGTTSKTLHYTATGSLHEIVINSGGGYDSIKV